MVEDDSERDLVVVDGTIADAAPVRGTEPDAAGWVLPGLVDVHKHLSLASPAGGDEDAAVRVGASASVELAVGVLALREPGSPDDASAQLAREDGRREQRQPAEQPDHEQIDQANAHERRG
jgi:imidazolonepropionase-like amidohydrolase